jgi:hypothetical protein
MNTTTTKGDTMTKANRDYYLNLVADSAELLARARLVNPDGRHADRMNPAREFRALAAAVREAREAGVSDRLVTRARKIATMAVTA